MIQNRMEGKNNMKKIASVLIALIFLIMAFTGCGTTTVKNIPVKDIMANIVSDTDLTTKMIDVSDNQIIATYGIDLSMLEEYSVKISNNIVSANTVAVFKLKDLKDLVTVQNCITKRKNDMVTTFQDYAPAESALAKNAVALTKGRYILFAVSKDAETVKTAFNDMFK
jgi:hypothetical protein